MKKIFIILLTLFSVCLNSQSTSKKLKCDPKKTINTVLDICNDKNGKKDYLPLSHTLFGKGPDLGFTNLICGQTDSCYTLAIPEKCKSNFPNDAFITICKDKYGNYSYTVIEKYDKALQPSNFDNNSIHQIVNIFSTPNDYEIDKNGIAFSTNTATHDPFDYAFAVKVKCDNCVSELLGSGFDVEEDPSNDPCDGCCKIEVIYPEQNAAALKATLCGNIGTISNATWGSTPAGTAGKPIPWTNPSKSNNLTCPPNSNLAAQNICFTFTNTMPDGNSCQVQCCAFICHFIVEWPQSLKMARNNFYTNSNSTSLIEVYDTPQS